ncbi:MAG: hypothetical protein Faunusvirus15_1 [Faunusvirus sp.]|jgi:hypothetical protein|uniref:Uncharacterized protein n=1 Tax=Faunusvirus sp. TaxID=2487766 RepID=A0A3G4ZX77_9VIRU|nr:MAG: hypothetical protein Faunusvirus15_1 [Faunusvirus sp.]
MNIKDNIKHASHLHDLLREYNRGNILKEQNTEIEDKCIKYIDTYTDFYNTQYCISSFKNITPLIYACICGNERIAAILIDKGANINTQCGDGITALIDAANHNMYNTVIKLIEHGADVNITTFNNKTALITACMSGYHNIAALLIQHGADVHVTTQYGSTALGQALNENFDTAILLMEHGADITDTNKWYKTMNPETNTHRAYRYMYTQYNKSISAVVNGDICFRQTYVPGLIEMICDFIL